MKIILKTIIILFFILGIILSFNFFFNRGNTAIVIGYQTGIDPTKVAQANKEYEKYFGKPILWKKFDNGTSIISAMLSKDVDIANIGSSVLASAASKEMPIEVFYIASILGSSEALIVQKDLNINNPEDLIGKTIAVPFVSTSHYSLLSILKYWHLDPKKINVVNLNPNGIIMAWKNKKIDAAYVWEPVLSNIGKNKKNLITSKEVANLGSPTYDIWVVRKDFAIKNPKIVENFVEVSNREIEKYLSNPNKYINDENIEKIANITGSKKEYIPIIIHGNLYLKLEEQLKLFNKKFADDLKSTAKFLIEQKKIDKIKQDYTENINIYFIEKAIRQKYKK